jgi:hypothetical protein
MTKIPTVKTGGGGGIFLMGDANETEMDLVSLLIL